MGRNWEYQGSSELGRAAKKSSNKNFARLDPPPLPKSDM